jgi:NAD(P)H dehydrogenase (quinone)
MRVLTVIANPNPESFCHAVLERFTAGLKVAGHVTDVVDLYAIEFDPVFRPADMASYVHESMPLEVLETMHLKEQVLASAGGPIRRFLASRWLRDKDLPAVAKFIHEHRPKDVLEQWEKVARAQGLAFIAPVFWLGYPAILKGWFERVFSYGDAYSLTPAGWRGEVKGRVPLLQHEKALIINTTLFGEEDYKADWAEPMARIMDDWSLRYPGVRNVEHVYFYAVSAVDDRTRQGYLERAYRLGQEFAQS